MGKLTQFTHLACAKVAPRNAKAATPYFDKKTPHRAFDTPHVLFATLHFGKF